MASYSCFSLLTFNDHTPYLLNLYLNCHREHLSVTWSKLLQNIPLTVIYNDWLLNVHTMTIDGGLLLVILACPSLQRPSKSFRRQWHRVTIKHTRDLPPEREIITTLIWLCDELRNTQKWPGPQNMYSINTSLKHFSSPHWTLIKASLYMDTPAKNQTPRVTKERYIH